jgi:cell division protein FtsN
MEFNWSTIAWIAGLLFVYIFGLYEGRSQGYKKRKAEEEQEKKTQPPPEPETVTVDDPGILRIKNENGAFALDLDGNRVNPISLVPEQRKRLIEILNIMRPWLEGKPASPPAATSQPPAFRPSTTPSLQTQSRPAPVQPASPPPPAPTSQPGPPKPAVIPVEDRPAAPANSIVTQIDTILQARLAGTPLEERGVFLTQSPEGGVIVYIGLKRYNGLDEVPDPEIKAAIRGAITEWENKYTPGM